MFLDLDLDQFEFWLGITVCGVSILVAAAFMFRHLRRYRLITDTPTAMIRSAPQGYVELIGHVISGEDGLLKAPLSERPCVWYSYKVERQKANGKKGWEVHSSGTSDQWFQIDDGTGLCLIDPAHAEIDAIQRRVWHGNLSDSGTSFGLANATGSSFAFGARYRYSETLIMEHEEIYALGQFQTPGHQESINLPDLHVLTKPDTAGLPLLISTQNEDKLAHRFRIRVALSLTVILAALWFSSELLMARVI